MNDNPGDILIKHPPIEELSEKKSCFRRTCFNGCGCLLFLIVGSVLFLKFVAIPKEKTLPLVPAALSSQIPLYDTTQIHSIRFTPGIERQQKIELLAFFPKLFVSPFIVHFPKVFFSGAPKELTSKKDLFYAFMRKPVIENTDIYTLVWNNLSAEPNFMGEYYKTELLKKGFTQIAEQKTPGTTIITYIKEQTLVELRIEDKNTEKIGTDKTTLVISLKSALEKVPSKL